MLWTLGWSTLFSIPKAAGTQLLVQFRNSPGALTFGRRGLLTTIRRGEWALSIDQLGDLSMHHRRPQMPAMTLLEWSQSPIRIFALIFVAQSIDQIRSDWFRAESCACNCPGIRSNQTTALIVATLFNQQSLNGCGFIGLTRKR
jgi:hypothetical protein